jgi:general secretion pathway protein I
VSRASIGASGGKAGATRPGGPGEPRSRSGRAAGFTLLEVMVAMAILALSLVTAFEVVGGALRAHQRARDLELATILARAKLAEVEARFQEEGFKDFDENGEGTFEEDGHPEIKWATTSVKPTVELGAEGVIKAITGVEGGLEGLLAQLGGAGAGGKTAAGQAADPTTAMGASPLAGMASALLGQQLTALGDQIKKGVRELRLTVAWPDGARTESFTVVTYLVVLAPGGNQPAAQATVPATVPAMNSQGQPPGLPPGFSFGSKTARGGN